MVDVIYFGGNKNDQTKVNENIKDYHYKFDSTEYTLDTANNLKASKFSVDGRKYNLSTFKVFDTEDKNDGAKYSCTNAVSHKWYWFGSDDTSDIND